MKAAEKAGLKSFSVTGDAFTDETKAKAVELIRSKLGQVDLVVYSVASARRTNPVTGAVANSVLKPIGQAYTNKTVNFHNGEVSLITIDPAVQEEINETVEVMGGDDWQLWIDAFAARRRIG